MPPAKFSSQIHLGRSRPSASPFPVQTGQHGHISGHPMYKFFITDSSRVIRGTKSSSLIHLGRGHGRQHHHSRYIPVISGVISGHPRYKMSSRIHLGRSRASAPTYSQYNPVFTDSSRTISGTKFSSQIHLGAFFSSQIHLGRSRARTAKVNFCESQPLSNRQLLRRHKPGAFQR